MLAPVAVEKSEDRFVRIFGNDCIEMRIRWHYSRELFSTPSAFIEDLQRMLRPISEAITYGEVVDLRQRAEAQRKQIEQLEKQVADLKRYRDAIDLLGHK